MMTILALSFYLDVRYPFSNCVYKYEQKGIKAERAAYLCKYKHRLGFFKRTTNTKRTLL